MRTKHRCGWRRAAARPGRASPWAGPALAVAAGLAIAAGPASAQTAPSAEPGADRPVNVRTVELPFANCLRIAIATRDRSPWGSISGLNLPDQRVFGFPRRTGILWVSCRRDPDVMQTWLAPPKQPTIPSLLSSEARRL